MVRAVTEAGEHGATLEEIAERLGIGRDGRDKISATIANAERLGLVARVGQRRPASSGRHQQVWVARGLVGGGVDVAQRKHLGAKAGAAAARLRPSPPPAAEDWPRDVRRAVDLLRRRGFAPVVPVDGDTWQVEAQRLDTGAMIEKAARIEARLMGARA